MSAGVDKYSTRSNANKAALLSKCLLRKGYMQHLGKSVMPGAVVSVCLCLRAAVSFWRSGQEWLAGDVNARAAPLCVYSC